MPNQFNSILGRSIEFQIASVNGVADNTYLVLGNINDTGVYRFKLSNDDGYIEFEVIAGKLITTRGFCINPVGNEKYKIGFTNDNGTITAYVSYKGVEKTTTLIFDYTLDSFTPSLTRTVPGGLIPTAYDYGRFYINGDLHANELILNSYNVNTLTATTVDVLETINIGKWELSVDSAGNELKLSLSDIHDPQ